MRFINKLFTIPLLTFVIPYIMLNVANKIGFHSDLSWLYAIVISELITILIFYKEFKVRDKRVDMKLVDKANLLVTMLAQIITLSLVSLAVSQPLLEKIGVDTSVGTGPIDSGIVMFVYAIIVGPLLEELLCRYLGFRMLREYKPHVRIVFTALAFSLLHFNINQTLYTFIGGILFGYLYEKTGDIRCTILLHTLNNLISRYHQIDLVANLIFALIMLAIATWLFIITMKLFELEKNQQKISIRQHLKILLSKIKSDILPYISYMVIVTIIVHTAYIIYKL